MAKFTGHEPLRVAYLATHYPALSHVFIEREVRGLRETGVHVATYSIRPTNPNDTLSAANQAASASTTCLFDLPKSTWLKLHLTCMLRSPRAYLRAWSAAMRMGNGLREKTWQLFYFLEAVTLFSHARAQSINHLHVHHANNVAEVARLACLLSAREPRPWTWSLTMHGSAEFWNVERFQLVNKVKYAQFVACISDFTRSQLMALVPQEHWGKLHIVHMGVDLELYPSFGEGRAERDPAAPLRVLFVGRLLAAKGISLLVQAIQELRLEGFAVEARIVGDGPYRRDLDAQISGAALSGVVEMRGPLGQEDLVVEYAWADVFCLPSFIEGVPVVLMEAMATELPVLTTRITGITELVDDGLVGGVLVRPGRVDELVESLKRMGSSLEWARELGRSGRIRVSEDFDSAKEATKLASLLRSYNADLQVSSKGRR